MTPTEYDDEFAQIAARLAHPSNQLPDWPAEVDDPHAPARRLLLGVIVGAACWAFIGWVVTR